MDRKKKKKEKKQKKKHEYQLIHLLSADKLKINKVTGMKTELRVV